METWEKAYEDYCEGMKYKDIAKKYETTLNTVKGWKKNKWPKGGKARKLAGTKLAQPSGTKAKQRESAKSARGAPMRNQNSTTHGLFAKWLPNEINEIVGETPENPLELLWINIQLQQAKIIRSFKIQHVKDEEDYTARIISSSSKGEMYQYHEAFEKDANFLHALSRAMGTLSNMIKQYEELLHANWDLATDLQKARLDQMQAEAQRIRADMEGAEGQAVQIIDDIPEVIADGSKAD